MPHPLVAVIMGSSSDWETMKHAVEVLDSFGVEHERHIVSAHRTPLWLAEFAGGAETRGVEVIIAGAGGAAHLPGMVAAHTVVTGYPAMQHGLWKRLQATLQRLPAMFQRLREVEDRVHKLEHQESEEKVR